MNQIAEPECQTIHYDGIVTTLFRRDTSSHGERFLPGCDLGATLYLVALDALPHLIVPGLSGREKTYSGAGRPEHPQSRRALAAAATATDQNHVNTRFPRAP